MSDWFHASDRQIELIEMYISNKSIGELKEIIRQASDLLERMEEWSRPSENVNATLATNEGFYRQEWVKCGKEGCKCSKGQLHGPYWYKYTYSAVRKRQQKTYIGKSL